MTAEPIRGPGNPRAAKCVSSFIVTARHVTLPYPRKRAATRPQTLRRPPMTPPPCHLTAAALLLGVVRLSRQPFLDRRSRQRRRPDRRDPPRSIGRRMAARASPRPSDRAKRGSGNDAPDLFGRHHASHTIVERGHRRSGRHGRRDPRFRRWRRASAHVRTTR